MVLLRDKKEVWIKGFLEDVRTQLFAWLKDG